MSERPNYANIEVTRTYQVPCLHAPYGLIPVMGSRHDDALLIGGEGAQEHYHHHPQFTPPDVLRYLVARSSCRDGEQRRPGGVLEKDNGGEARR